MSQNSISPAGLAGQALPQRVWTPMRMLGFVSVTLFVATEVAAACGAGIWAISGLLGLGTVGTEVVAVLLGLPALYAVFKCAQLAAIAETDPVND